MAKKGGLGKGLDTLIPAKIQEPDSNNVDIKELTVKTSLIEPNKKQPRIRFNEDKLQELADSIKQFGLIEPLIVVQRGDRYELIAGERRWRAAMINKLPEVPVKIMEGLSEEEILELSLIENIQREDLNPIEEARAYQRLLTEFGLKQDEVAEKVSKSRTAVTNSMRLLKLSSRVQEMVIDEMIYSGHARALLSIEDEEEQFRIAQKIFDENLSVRDVEKLVRNLIKDKEKIKKQKEDDQAEQKKKAMLYQYEEMAGRLREVLGRKVSVAGKGDGTGKIEVEFYDNNDFDELAAKLLTLKEG